MVALFFHSYDIHMHQIEIWISFSVYHPRSFGSILFVTKVYSSRDGNFILSLTWYTYAAIEICISFSVYRHIHLSRGSVLVPSFKSHELNEIRLRSMEFFKAQHSFGKEHTSLYPVKNSIPEMKSVLEKLTCSIHVLLEGSWRISASTEK